MTTLRFRQAAASLALGALALPAAAQTHDHAAMQRAAAATPDPLRGAVQADVDFMQGMIPHHAQALEMIDLVAARTPNVAFHRFTERMQVAQGDEIRWMQNWLHTHGQPAPELGPDHRVVAGGMDHSGMNHAGMNHGGGHLMPGMLSPEQMADLAASTGPAFERKFLTYMIRHHEGALLMVDTLFATPGAGQLPEVYTIATDIDADQRADILRMRAMLAALPPDPTPAPAPGHPHH